MSEDETISEEATTEPGRVRKTVDLIDDVHSGKLVNVKMHLEAIAAAAHMANRAYCLGIGDLSQPSWETAPQWAKDSAIAGVKAILENPATTPEQSHEGWLKQKEADGWKYGPVKDPEKKEHPCFLPYSELPEAQKLKDRIFGITVRSLAKVMGLL